jgi:hypothetical protein
MSETIKRYTLIHRPGQTQPELVVCEKSDYNAMCYSRDVSFIEAKCAELEAKCAELLKGLEAIENGVKIGLPMGEILHIAKKYRKAAARVAIAKAKGEVMP